jgi:hypothetical protein
MGLRFTPMSIKSTVAYTAGMNKMSSLASLCVNVTKFTLNKANQTHDSLHVEEDLL